MTWETIIGLEVHAQLNTRSKLFSNAKTTYGATPNSQTHYIDAGLPGTLPVLNQEAVIKAIQFGIAINAEINDLSFFERKNYFYPDLPKGYQISQFQRPIIGKGSLTISSEEIGSKKILINRAHLEEDAGKSIHDAHRDYSSIDLNRAGTPLLEIVTEPCLRSAAEVVCYLKTLQQLLRFLNICDGNMQEGSLRCDVNLSIKKTTDEKLGTRTELKNLNSFRFIEKAIAYEKARHIALLEQNQKVIQQTRLYCPDTDTTIAMRSKEDENDYRYFPDPDLCPIKITTSMLENIKQNMPMLPDAIRQTLLEEDKLIEEDVTFLLSSKSLVEYYTKVKKHTHAENKVIINWLKGTYTAALNENALSFDTPLISAERFATLLNRLTDNKISLKIAKQIFTKLIASNKEVDEIIEEEGFKTVDNEDLLQKLIMDTISNFPEQANDYRAGKEKLLSFFIGQIMQKTKGQAAPEKVNELLKKLLLG